MINKELEEKVKLIKEKSPKDLTYSDKYYLWEYNRLTNSSNKWDEGEEVKIYDGPALASNKLKNGFGMTFLNGLKHGENILEKKFQLKLAEKFINQQVCLILIQIIIIYQNLKMVKDILNLVLEY